MMKIKQKKPFTLLEIMIVILLIGLIGSVIGYNMKGSLDEGRAFKTRQGMAQIIDIFELEMAKTGLSAKDIADNPEKYLKLSGLVKDPDKFVLDGWGKRFDFSVDTENNTFTISSSSLTTYKHKKSGILGSPHKKENEEAK